MSTVTTEGAVVDGVNKQLFIGGEWRDASDRCCVITQRRKYTDLDV